MNMEDSILELDKQMNDIIKDIRKRVDEVYSKYTNDSGGATPLPSYEEMVKSPKLRYNISKRIMDEMDELAKLKIRVGVVERNLSGMKNIQITNRSDYTLIANLKSNIKKYADEMSEYRFDISDLIRNANNKIKILESASFYID